MKITTGWMPVLGLAVLLAGTVSLSGAYAYFTDRADGETSDIKPASVKVGTMFDEIEKTPSVNAPQLDSHFGSWSKGDSLESTLLLSYEGNIEALILPEVTILDNTGADITHAFSGTVKARNTEDDSWRTKSFDQGTCAAIPVRPGTVEVVFSLSLTEDLAENTFPVPAFSASFVQRYGNEELEAGGGGTNGNSSEGFGSRITSGEFFDTAGKPFGKTYSADAYRSCTLSFTVTPDKAVKETQVRIFAPEEDLSQILMSKLLLSEHITEEKEYSLPFVIREGNVKHVAVDAFNETAGHRIILYSITCTEGGRLIVTGQEVDLQGNCIG